ERYRNAHRIDREPDIAGLSRPEMGGDVARKDQRAPQDQHQAGGIVDRRLPNPADDGLDLVEGLDGLLAVDGHEMPAVMLVLSDRAASQLAPLPDDSGRSGCGQPP